MVVYDSSPLVFWWEHHHVFSSSHSLLFDITSERVLGPISSFKVFTHVFCSLYFMSHILCNPQFDRSTVSILYNFEFIKSYMQDLNLIVNYSVCMLVIKSGTTSSSLTCGSILKFLPTASSNSSTNHQYLFW